jgi:ribonuclease HI
VDINQKIDILEELSRNLSITNIRKAFPDCSLEELRLLFHEAKEMFREDKVQETPLKRLKIYTDGASRGNPGEAGAGVVILNEKNESIRELSRYLGQATNNVAEYQGLLLSLEKASELGAEEVDIFSDSELLTRQVNGIYKVKNEKLKPLYQKVLELRKNFKKFSITHIAREKNKAADKLANKAIDTMPK